MAIGPNPDIPDAPFRLAPRRRYRLHRFEPKCGLTSLPTVSRRDDFGGRQWQRELQLSAIASERY